jgi:hypothetical protein
MQQVLYRRPIDFRRQYRKLTRRSDLTLGIRASLSLNLYDEPGTYKYAFRIIYIRHTYLFLGVTFTNVISKAVIGDMQRGSPLVSISQYYVIFLFC